MKMLTELKFGVLILCVTIRLLNCSHLSLTTASFNHQFLKAESPRSITTTFLDFNMLLVAIFCLVIWYLISGISAWWKLRKFPATSWLAHSYLWVVKTTYSGRQYWVHRVLHREHKLVRIGPNELITGDPEIIRRINKERSGYNRGAWYNGGRINPYYDNIFSQKQPAAHTKYKSRVAHGYTGREILDTEIDMDEQLDTLLSVMRDRYARPGRHLELAEVTAFFTIEVITRLAFGEAFGYLSRETDLYGFLGSLRILWPSMSTLADVS